MRLRFCALAGATALGGMLALTAAQSQDFVRVDGSSTVFPISEAMAEEFQRSHGAHVVVGLSGTGGGFKKFCRGDVDITGASRPIKRSEADACRGMGIEFIELPIALDALAVVVNPRNTWVDYLTVAELKKCGSPKRRGWLRTGTKFVLAFQIARFAYTARAWIPARMITLRSP